MSSRSFTDEQLREIIALFQVYGDIKAVKFGRRWRIDTAALLRQFGIAD